MLYVCYRLLVVCTRLYVLWCATVCCRLYVVFCTLSLTFGQSDNCECVSKNSDRAQNGIVLQLAKCPCMYHQSEKRQTDRLQGVCDERTSGTDGSFSVQKFQLELAGSTETFPSKCNAYFRTDLFFSSSSPEYLRKIYVTFSCSFFFEGMSLWTTKFFFPGRCLCQ